MTVYIEDIIDELKERDKNSEVGKLRDLCKRQNEALEKMISNTGGVHIGVVRKLISEYQEISKS